MYKSSLRLTHETRPPYHIYELWVPISYTHLKSGATNRHIIYGYHDKTLPLDNHDDLANISTYNLRILPLKIEKF